MDFVGQNQDLLENVFDSCSSCVWIVKIRVYADGKPDIDSDEYPPEEEGEGEREDDDDDDEEEEREFGNSDDDDDEKEREFGNFDDDDDEEEREDGNSDDDNEEREDGNSDDDNEEREDGNSDDDDNEEREDGNSDDDDDDEEREDGNSDDNDDVDDEGEGDYLICLTAFAVGCHGLLLTCAHGNWNINPEKIRIRAKQLGGEQIYTARVVAYLPTCDLCLLIVPCRLDNVVTWGTGNVKIGERVFLFGHPESLLGTLVIGAASYGCSENVEFNLTDNRSCSNFHNPGWLKPQYRIMGHVWHAGRFANMELEERAGYLFEQNYVARLPIIQCCNLVGGPGASGGPIFNMQGHVCGMLVGAMERYQIGVHVCALKQFVEDAEPLGNNLFKSMEQKIKLLERNKSEQGIDAHQEPSLKRARH